jgi:hypothetical protein
MASILAETAEKWAGSWVTTTTTYTTCWVLPQLGPGSGPAGTDPLLWMRHDRSPPERLRIFINDEQYYGRRGVADKATTATADGGDREDVSFTAEGFPNGARVEIKLTISTGPAKGGSTLGQLGRAASVTTYSLAVDGVLKQPHHCGTNAANPAGAPTTVDSGPARTNSVPFVHYGLRAG